MRRGLLFLFLLALLVPRYHTVQAHDASATTSHAYLAASASDHGHDGMPGDAHIDGDPCEAHVHVDTGGHAFAALVHARPPVAVAAAHRPDEPRPGLAPDPPPLPLLRPPAAR